MTKYIEVKLTEDQALSLSWLIEDYDIRLADLNEPEWTDKARAFNRRIHAKFTTAIAKYQKATGVVRNRTLSI